MEVDLEEGGISDPAEKKAAAKVDDVKVESDSKEVKNVMLSQQKYLLAPDNEGPKSNSDRVPAKKEEEEDDDDEEEEEHDLVKGDGLQGDHKAGIQLEDETEIDESQV